jgi:hypothetical protein
MQKPSNQKSPAMGRLITLLIDDESYQVKSLILAQIERWRRA